jgi:hypothetical protein
MSTAVVSTAIFKDTAAGQSSSSDTMIGIAGDALHGNQHAAAESSPFLACVHEEEQRRPNRCCAKKRNTKLMLAAVATFLIVAGVVMGVGIHFGTQKGKGSPCMLHASMRMHLHAWSLAAAQADTACSNPRHQDLS